MRKRTKLWRVLMKAEEEEIKRDQKYDDFL